MLRGFIVLSTAQFITWAISSSTVVLNLRGDKRVPPWLHTWWGNIVECSLSNLLWAIRDPAHFTSHKHGQSHVIRHLGIPGADLGCSTPRTRPVGTKSHRGQSRGACVARRTRNGRVFMQQQKLKEMKWVWCSHLLNERRLSPLNKAHTDDDIIGRIRTWDHDHRALSLAAILASLCAHPETRPHYKLHSVRLSVCLLPDHNQKRGVFSP